MDKFIGKRLDGRYEIHEILGVGGMAVVYKAYDNLENKTVAVKILKEEYARNEEFLRRFKNESKAISLLSHPNIVKIFDVSFGDIIQYIVMEYIDGITLKEYIEKQISLSWKDAVHFTLQILRGLQHAHDRGIVHRDVKPQNIMVLPDNTIKVTDFGIARFARSEQKTITDKAIGSVHYISPEQACGEITDEKADIYSVGVMMYEMLTGQLPFQAESAVSVAIMQLQREPKPLTDINGSIPQGLEQIVMHAMQKDTMNRYKSSSEMLCDLEKFKKDPALTFEYTYFVDDSPTKFINVDEAKVQEEKQEGSEEKAPIIPILAGVAVTFVVAIVALIIFFVPKFTGSTGSEIKCPQFIGMQQSEVIANAEFNNNFKLTFKSDYNSEYPVGVIYNQSQPADRNLKKNATITLYVSMGSKTLKVPDVSGSTETYAINQLKAEGFKVKTARIADENVEKDLIVKTDPAIGSSVAEGTEITIFISDGPPTIYVTVPNVVTYELEDAKRMITAAGFVVGEIKEVDNSKYPKGTVEAQDPDPKTTKKAGLGTTINIAVSSGVTRFTSDVTVELPEGITKVSLWINGEMQQESAELDGSAESYKFKEISASTEKVSAVIKIQNIENMIYTPLYEGTINLSSGKFNIVTKYNVNPAEDEEPDNTPTDSDPETPVEDPNEEPEAEVPNEEPEVEVPNEEPEVEVPNEEPEVEIPNEESQVEDPQNEVEVETPENNSEEENNAGENN